MVVINGKEEQAAGFSVNEWLDKIGFKKETVAVEYNGEILPKTRYGKTALKDGDKLEIVRFMGGG